MSSGIFRLVVGLFIWLVAALGCAGPSKPSDNQSDVVAPAEDVDTTTTDDAGQSDVQADSLAGDLDLLDIGTDLDALDCPGNAGCTCAVDGDCNTGFCVETPAGNRCAPLCTTGCPTGAVCRASTTEAVNYCAPLAVRDCAPCQDNNDCNAKHSVPAVCTKAGLAGSFCATQCQIQADCPAGTTCELTQGGTSKVCMPQGGLAACTCSAWAISAKSATQCEILSDNSLCPGTRTCTAGGLSACTLTAGELCVDAGCKGVADGVICTDTDPCTASTTCKAGKCQGGVSSCECQADTDCASKNDNNLCNGTYFCEASSHTCQVNPVTVVQCPKSSNSCEAAVCEPTTGACSQQALPDNTACDDNKSCTVGDVCNDGKCVAGTVTCTCSSNADCAAYEDGNACNGSLFCNKAKGQCQVNPATVVVCKSGQDTTCLQNVCDPNTGACALSQAATTTLCDDGNPCTAGEKCNGGQCLASTDICPCSQDADCAGQEDGNLCNGTLYCELTTATCKLNPASVVVCPTKATGPCTPIQCQPETGVCVASPLLAGACDDGDPCTANEQCVAGACVAEISLCQCETTADCGAFDDSDPCNGTMYCDNATNRCKINPLTVVDCPDASTPCTALACDSADGQCKPVVSGDGEQCEDGEPCTKNDRCLSGSCTPGKSVCACYLDSQCAGKDDGNLCNGLWFCDKSDGTPACAFDPLTVVQCVEGDDDPCTLAACATETGDCVVTASSGDSCEDGNACTAFDLCEAGSCASGPAKDCDDHNACTTDACDPASGCSYSPVSGCANLPYLQTFDCDMATDWTLATAMGDLGWGIDATPKLPVPNSANCALNFNNGQNFGCPSGEPMVLPAAATSPWLDATALPPDQPLVVSARINGLWESGPYDNLQLQVRKYGADWSLVADLDTTEPNSLAGMVANRYSFALPAELAGHLFQLQWVFWTTDCEGNGGSGPFVDDFQVVALACAATADCDDGNTCTAETCDTETGRCGWLATKGNCDDGNVCNGPDKCTAGRCKATEPAAPCDDGTTCTNELCDPDTGCSYDNNVPITDCPGVVVDGRCLGIVHQDQAMSWYEAHARCGEWGGVVASIRTQAEAEAIPDTLSPELPAGSFLAPFVTRAFWIGLSDRAQTGVLAWSNGDPLDYQQFSADVTFPPFGGTRCTGWARGGIAGNFGAWVEVPCDSQIYDVLCAKAAYPTCDDGKPCTLEDRCQDGQCYGQKIALNVARTQSWTSYFMDVAASARGFALVGTAYDKPYYQVNDRVLRPIMPYAMEQVDVGGTGRFNTVTSDSSSYWLAGEAKLDGDPNDGQGTLMRVGLDGTPIFGPLTYGSFGFDRIEGITPFAGGAAMVGFLGSGGAGIGPCDYGWLLVVNDKGEQLVSKSYHRSGGFCENLHSVQVLPDGDLLLAGDTGGGWLIRTKPDGTEVWQKFFPAPNPNEPRWFTDMVLYNNKVFAVGAHQQELGKRDVWVWAGDLNGTMLWETNLGELDTFEEGNAITVDANGVAIAGSTSGFGATTTRDGFVALLDETTGNLKWLQRLPKATNSINGTFGEEATGIASLHQGEGWVFAGQDNLNHYTARPWFGRITPEGKLTCLNPGECLSEEPEICNDNSPCTVDSCQDGKCVFEPVPDGDNGSVCEDDIACTVDGCTAGKCSNDSSGCACGELNPAASCKGVCGGTGSGQCMCDAECAGYGDCCSDIAVCCLP